MCVHHVASDVLTPICISVTYCTDENYNYKYLYRNIFKEHFFYQLNNACLINYVWLSLAR